MARLTAVVPYLGYARKDRRTARGEAVSLRVVADVIESSGAERAVLVDPHVPQVDSIFSIPLEVVSAVPLLAAAIAPVISDDAIVVAPWTSVPCIWQSDMRPSSVSKASVSFARRGAPAETWRSAVSSVISGTAPSC